MRDEDAEPGMLAHALDRRAHGLGAADDRGAAGDELVGGQRCRPRATAPCACLKKFFIELIEV